MSRVLLSWIADTHDFLRDRTEVEVNTTGPHCLLYENFHNYDRHVLLSANGPSYSESESFARKTKSGQLYHRLSRYQKGDVDVRELNLASSDVISVSAIKPLVREVVLELLQSTDTLDIFISPGTPAMQIAWYLTKMELFDRGDQLRLFQTVAPWLSPDKKTPQQQFIDFENENLVHGVILKTKKAKSDKTEGHYTQSLKAVLRTADMIAETHHVHALIHGETGTGKEFLATRIHQNSASRNGRLIAVNCSAIPSELFESELFGHEKGAFTGAHYQKNGALEQANNGTLFLDELGELSLSGQAKLLRALSANQTFIRVGGTEPVTVDVRVVGATNVDLRKACEEGRFRWDLFYRLSTVEIQIPPFRQLTISERKEMLHHQIEKSRKQFLGKPLTFSTTAIDEILHYPFLGNLRELRNLVENCFVRCSDTVQVSDLPDYVQSFSESKGYAIKDLQARHSVHVLDLVSGNKKRAAKLLGISEPTLNSYLKHYETLIC